MAIFQRGWPVSRKEIREAVGLKEEDPFDALEGFEGLLHYVFEDGLQEEQETSRGYVPNEEDFPSLLG